ncbi:MAG TPA: hypothetical protein VKW06_00245 [Candidatus Angelobacter sp.]|nr:hypothetical protein [Candidatus Angelobacter sp.]
MARVNDHNNSEENGIGKLLRFPAEGDSFPSLASRKVLILEVLREVLAQEPQCYLKAPVDVLEIFTYRGCEGRLSTLVMAAFLLEKDGLAQTWSRLGKTFIELTDLGKKHVLGMAPGLTRGPEVPDYPGGQGDETDSPISGLSTDLSGGTQCETQAEGFHRLAGGQANIPPSLYRPQERGITQPVDESFPGFDVDRAVNELFEDMIAALPRAELYGLPERKGR